MIKSIRFISFILAIGSKPVYVAKFPETLCFDVTVLRSTILNGGELAGTGNLAAKVTLMGRGGDWPVLKAV